MSSKPDWWPKNPYYASVFTMSLDDVCDALPDPKVRTGVAGKMMHDGWELASEAILDRIHRYDAAYLKMQNAPATMRVILTLCELLSYDDVRIDQGSRLHEDLQEAEKELKL